MDFKGAITGDHILFLLKRITHHIRGSARSNCT